MRLFGNFWIYV